MSVLEVDAVSIHFGGIKALQNVNLRVGEWEIVGIIGPNGAGKTTLFNCITGFYQPTHGQVRYRGMNISKLPVHQHTALGIGRTFQNVGLVKGSTVRENLKTAQHLQAEYATDIRRFITRAQQAAAGLPAGQEEAKRQERLRAIELGRRVFEKEARRFDLNPKTLLESPDPASK